MVEPAPISTSAPSTTLPNWADKHVPAVGETVAETVGPQHGVGVDQAPRADHRVLVEHGVGEDRHVLADLRAGHDVDAGVDRRAGADRHAVADRGEGMDVDVCGRSSAVGLTAASGLMPIRAAVARRAEVAHDGGKRPMNVVDLDGRDALRARNSAAQRRPPPGNSPADGSSRTGRPG